MIRLGFVGAGLWMRTYHLPTARRLARENRVSLSAIWNRTRGKAESLAREFDIDRVHKGLSAFVAEPNIDAYVVALTKDSVGDVLRELGPRGVPILVEKPPAASATEAAELVELVPAPTLVAFNRNFTPVYERLKALLAERPVNYVECHFMRRRREDHHFVTETGIHALAFLDSLLGQATLTSVQRIDRCGGGAAALPADRHAELEHPGGVISQIHFMPYSGRAVELYQFHLADTSIYARMWQHYARDEESVIEIYRRSEDNGLERESLSFPREDSLRHDGYLGEYERFLTAIETGSDIATSLGYASRIMRLAEAIETG